MKKTLRFLSIGLMAFGLMFTQSCDKCKDVECQHTGTCDKGVCTCPPNAEGELCETCKTGYEGDDCNTEMRKKFLRTAASVSEVCGSNNYTYNTDIVAGSAINEIKIKNVGNYNCTSGDYYVVATVNGSNLTIASQSVCATTFSGSGSYSATNSKVTVTYTATYGTPSVTDNCTMTIN